MLGDEGKLDLSGPDCARGVGGKKQGNDWPAPKVVAEGSKSGRRIASRPSEITRLVIRWAKKMDDLTTEARAIGRRIPWGTVVLYVFIAGVAIILPLFLFALDLGLLDYVARHQIKFRWFALCGSLGVILVAYLELKKRSGQDFTALLPIVLWTLVSLHFLVLITHYCTPSHDYRAYERAAVRVAEGESPYHRATRQLRYLYPPFQAQVMAGLYRAIQYSHSALGGKGKRLNPWDTLFYLFQCAQFLVIVGAYWLCYLFARGLGVGKASAAMMAAGLLVFSSPLIRMLADNQVNIGVLDTILVAVLLVQHYPFLSGLAIAIGTHVKLYPAILLLPWAAARRWWTVLGALVSMAAIVLLLTDWGRDLHLYREFLVYYSSGEVDPYRVSLCNTSSYNVVFFVLRPLYLLGWMGVASYSTMVNVVSLLVAVAIFVWFGIRFRQRERAYAALVAQQGPNESGDWPFRFRHYGHAVDAVALGLLVSPSVWMHHWVLAIPIVLWAVATRGSDRPWHVAIAALLIVCIPTLGIVVLSWHSIVGLVMLMVRTAPQRITVPLDLQEGRVAEILRT